MASGINLSSQLHQSIFNNGIVKIPIGVYHLPADTQSGYLCRLLLHMIRDRFILPDENGFKDTLLDNFLAAGYYRMQHLIFTTHHTKLDATNGPVPVFWLRTCVTNLQESKAASAIRKKCQSFKIQYKTALVTSEQEELYQLYRNHVNFNTAVSCHDYLHQPELENPYDSQLVEIRDGDKLIAAGFFDKGNKSISGIINFYHPDYKSYSLGKMLVLTKIDYAIANAIPFYYTGYISTANIKFDYKIFPDINSVEVFLPIERIWKPYAQLGKEFLQKYFIQYLMNEEEV